VPLDVLASVLDRYYIDHMIDTPGVTPDDWFKLLTG
jgi:hypothetical protein